MNMKGAQMSTGSFPARVHTAYGKVQSRRTLESDHRFNHHEDSREVPHWDSDCKLCVEEHWQAVARQDNGWAR